MTTTTVVHQPPGARSRAPAAPSSWTESTMRAGLASTLGNPNRAEKWDGSVVGHPLLNGG